MHAVHGGMRAVIYTDIAQFLVLWGSISRRREFCHSAAPPPLRPY